MRPPVSLRLRPSREYGQHVLAAAESTIRIKPAGQARSARASAAQPEKVAWYRKLPLFDCCVINRISKVRWGPETELLRARGFKVPPPHGRGERILTEAGKQAVINSEQNRRQ